MDAGVGFLIDSDLETFFTVFWGGLDDEWGWRLLGARGGRLDGVEVAIKTKVMGSWVFTTWRR